MILKVEEGLSGQRGAGPESLWVLAYLTFTVNVFSVVAVSFCSWMAEFRLTRALVPTGIPFIVAYVWALLSMFVVPILVIVEASVLGAYRGNEAFRMSGLHRMHKRALAAGICCLAIMGFMTGLNWLRSR